MREFGRSAVHSSELGDWEAVEWGRGVSSVCRAKSGRERKSERLQQFVTP